MRRRALFYVNRSSRNGSVLAGRASAMLDKLGFDLIDVPPHRQGGLAAAIKRLGSHGADLAIVGGGDGTLNSAVDELARAKLPVGILPLGTANDFARTLGIPQSLQEACVTIRKGRVKAIDLGSVNGKFFLNGASLGLANAAAGRLTKAAKRRWGIFAAAGMAIASATRARRFRVNIRCDRKKISADAYQVIIGNGVFFGGFMANFDARVDDRLLDMIVLETKRIADLARMVPYAASGKYDANPYLLTMKGRHFDVTTSRTMRIFADGDLVGKTPATIRVAPSALKVIVPR
jgi:diacylglycerol kinase (ATP)